MSAFLGHVLAHQSRLIGWEMLVPAAIALTFLWAVINRVIRRRHARSIFVVQMCLATVGVTLALLTLAGRAGLVDCDPMGGAYWTTDNQTYRFKPRWVLGPLWGVAIGIGWYGLSYGGAKFLPRRRAGHG